MQEVTQWFQCKPVNAGIYESFPIGADKKYADFRAHWNGEIWVTHYGSKFFFQDRVWRGLASQPDSQEKT